jgi:hypothetical protein
MFLNDEKAKRALQMRKDRSSVKIVKWAKQRLLLREVSKLARKRRIVTRTVGRWIRTRNTRKLVAATRIVRAFLTQSALLSTQIRTIMQYRTYMHAVRTVSSFLANVRTRRQAQTRITAMIWEQAEQARREDMASALVDTYSHGIGSASPTIVNLGRHLRITTAAAAAGRAHAIREAAKRWERPVAEPVKKKGKKGAKAPAKAAAFSLSELKGTAGALQSSSPFDAAAQMGYTTTDDERSPRIDRLAGTLGGGMEEGAYNKFSNPNDRDHLNTNALENVMLCMQPVPAHEAVAAIARFLVYRRQERWAEYCAYKRKVQFLQPHIATQRKRLELVQRLAFRGPASMFVFDESELKALIPKAPKPFRNVPLRSEIIHLVESVQQEWFIRLGKVYAAEEAGAGAAGKAAAAKGEMDADDRKLEKTALSKAGKR